MIDMKKCKCGCGAIVKNEYVSGHNRRGMKNSATHNERIRKATIGHYVSSDTKEKLRSSITGRRHSEETKKKLSEMFLGRTFSRESRRKLSISHIGRGTKGTGWNISLHKYLSPFEYKELRETVLIRDKRRCISCLSRAKLDVHHVVPLRIGFKSRLCDHESNLVVLCHRCHASIEIVTNNRWRDFLYTAELHLAKFNYKKLLLSRYYNAQEA